MLDAIFGLIITDTLILPQHETISPLGDVHVLKRLATKIPIFDITPAVAKGSSDVIFLTMDGGGLILCGGRSAHQMGHALPCTTGGVSSAAPNHPFPAVLEDAVAAFEKLLESHSPARIVFHGGLVGKTSSRQRLGLEKRTNPDLTSFPG